MSSKPMRIPGPDHPITIEPNPARVVVRLGEKIIANTRNALTLREASYPPVQYIPRADVDMALLEASSHQTYCPYKGDASYLSLRGGDARMANAVWSYERPYEPAAEIAGYLAFYPDRFAIELRQD